MDNPEDWSLAAFLISLLVVTLAMGAGAAILTGRAVAQAWRPLWLALLAMVPLAAAVRFVDFVLFQTELQSAWLYLLDLAVLIPAAALGHRATRVGQMTRIYPWVVERAGVLSWRRREDR